MADAKEIYWYAGIRLGADDKERATFYDEQGEVAQFKLTPFLRKSMGWANIGCAYYLEGEGNSFTFPPRMITNLARDVDDRHPETEEWKVIQATDKRLKEAKKQNDSADINLILQLRKIRRKKNAAGQAAFDAWLLAEIRK